MKRKGRGPPQEGQLLWVRKNNLWEQGLQTGVGPDKQSGLKQWMTTGLRLQLEHKGMPGLCKDPREKGKRDT